MADATIHQVLRLDQGRIGTDGQTAEFALHTAAGLARLCLPVADLSLILQFFASLASAAGSGAPLPQDLYPVTASGLGVQDGPTPDTVLLVLRFGAAALTVETERTKATDMAQRLLLSASAPPTAPHLN